MRRLGVILTAAGCITLLGYWLLAGSAPDTRMRVPIPGNRPPVGGEALEAAANPGTLTPGEGVASSLPGSWPQFRGPRRDNIVPAAAEMAATWPQAGPPVLWKVQLGEGHGGAAIHQGRVYLLDYDEKAREDVARCLSLDDGREIWRYSYSVKIKRNHGMSRTVPAVSDDYVVTLGPKGHVHCLAAASGERVWRVDLVRDYGATIPEWYAGQCPLIEEDRVILAPGGRCLLTALSLATGETLWETPNPKGWKMTHTSILPIVFEGERQYVWCADDGVVGVSAASGELLWSYPDWRIKVATVPSPVDLGEGRLFLSGGYNAGAAMIRLVRKDGAIVPETLFRTEAKVFGSDQQTPLYANGMIYGVAPGGRLVCLSPDGEPVWEDKEHNFGLGPYILLDGKLLVLDDDQKKPGGLCLFEIGTTGVRLLSRAAPLEGFDAWAPIAWASGRAVLRDSHTMVCLDLTVSGSEK